MDSNMKLIDLYTYGLQKMINTDNYFKISTTFVMSQNRGPFGFRTMPNKHHKLT